MMKLVLMDTSQLIPQLKSKYFLLFAKKMHPYIYPLMIINKLNI